MNFRKESPMKLSNLLFAALACGVLCSFSSAADAANTAVPRPLPLAETGDLSRGADNFYVSGRLDSETVTFHNIYQMKMEGTLFTPKDMDRSKHYPAVIVGHPMGAVREQSANLYAQKMAEQGFVTLTADLSFWGGSEGMPRNAVDPTMYAETFSAAADYLDTLSFVDRDHIGVIGICGSGSYAVAEAKIDPRLKAIATVSMYDMGKATRSGLRESQTLAQRKAILEEAAAQRDREYAGAPAAYTSGTPEHVDENSPAVAREFYDYYRTSRGASDRTNTHPLLTSNVKLMNFYPFNDIDTISPRPLLFIAGTDAHSREFSEDAYRLAAEPKELVLVPNAGHVDLYDRVDVIPWQTLFDFFHKYLK